MFEGVAKFFKKLVKSEQQETKSKDTAKERLHLVLMQDRANVSADFLELMKQEIIEVIKKYIEVDDKEIDVRLTNKIEEDGTNGSPFLYANIPIVKIKNDVKVEKQEKTSEKNNETKKDEDKKEVSDSKNETEEPEEAKTEEKDNETIVESKHSEEKIEEDKQTTKEGKHSKEKIEKDNKEEKSEQKDETQTDKNKENKK